MQVCMNDQHLCCLIMGVGIPATAEIWCLSVPFSHYQFCDNPRKWLWCSHYEVENEYWMQYDVWGIIRHLIYLVYHLFYHQAKVMDVPFTLSPHFGASCETPSTSTKFDESLESSISQLSSDEAWLQSAFKCCWINGHAWWDYKDARTFCQHRLQTCV